jgi:hypothetical protein
VIAPLLAGREASFAEEIRALAVEDAEVVRADHAALRDRDLGPAVIGAPGSTCSPRSS